MTKHQPIASATGKTAILYRMVMPKHVCPWGLKAKHLLESQGFVVGEAGAFGGHLWRWGFYA